MHTAHTLEIDTDASHVWQDMYLYITYVYYLYIPYVAHELWHTHLRLTQMYRVARYEIYSTSVAHDPDIHNIHTAHKLEIDTDVSYMWQDVYLYITYVCC